MFADLVDKTKTTVGSVFPFLFDAKAVLNQKRLEETQLRAACDLMTQEGWAIFDAFLQLRETFAEQEILALSRKASEKSVELQSAHARRDEIQALRQFAQILPGEWKKHKEEILKLVNHIADTQTPDGTL